MNYYEHHLGDYDGNTAHLSWAEDCAYRRLICLYYRTEKPIPADIKKVYRLVRATSKQERDAVQQVLNEFFEIRVDGWHNDRCDDEIARYLDKQEKAKRSANARWSKTKTETESNANGHANAYANASKTYANSQCVGNAHQTPDYKNISQDTLLPTQPTPTPLPSPRVAVDNSKPYGKAAAALIPLGVKVTAQHPVLIAWIDEGFTIDQLTAAVAIARLNKPEPEAIPANYLDRIVRDPPKPSKPKERRAAWWETEQGILAQGAELGMVPRAGEGWPEFKQRISVEIDRRKATA